MVIEIRMVAAYTVESDWVEERKLSRATEIF